MISTFERVSSGVPQGSILGPLLFLISCNKLPEIASGVRILIFADGTSIVNKHELFITLTENLHLLLKWYKVYVLRLNPG